VRCSASHHRSQRQHSPSPLDSEDSVVCLEDPDAETLDRAEQRQRSPSPLDSEDSVVCLEDLDAETLDRAEHTAAGALQSAPSAPSQAEAENLAEDRLVAQSAAADLAPDQAAPIDDAIDHITAQLAAFCFEQLVLRLLSYLIFTRFAYASYLPYLYDRTVSTVYRTHFRLCRYLDT
jgi:hypothetical protein